MWQRFTERARKAVFIAHEQVTKRKTFLVLPHDLAVGALNAEGSVCKELLERAGLDVAEFLHAVSKIPSDPGKPGILGTVGLSDTGKAAIEAAKEEAKRLGVDYISSEHILLGALRVSPEIQEILRTKGLVVDDLRQKLVELLDEPKSIP